MSLKNKILQTVLTVICALLLILAVFLGVVALIFSSGKGNPNVFGSNVYLVRTEAFGFLHSGTAVFSKEVPPSEIQSPNIVIFKLENGRPALAQIAASELIDGRYIFTAVTENNSQITLVPEQIVAKGMRYSDFWGGLIGFAVSPLGMLLIAVTPAVIIIVSEILRFASKLMPKPEITPVRKQYETPTYSPEQSRERERRGTAEAVKAYKGASLDSSIGLYDAAVRKATTADRERSEYMESLARSQSPLFTAPQRERAAARQQTQAMPLSQKALNDAIAETKAEHELDEMKKRRAQVVKDIQKTRGAVIAKEKEYETAERELRQAAAQPGRPRTDTGTVASGDTSKTTVMDRIKPSQRGRTLSSQALRTQAVSQTQQQRTLRTPAPQTQQQPADAAPRRPARPPLHLGADEQPRSASSPRVSSNTATSIPRLDAVLKDDSDLPDIEDILAGLDRRKN